MAVHEHTKNTQSDQFWQRCPIRSRISKKCPSCHNSKALSGKWLDRMGIEDYMLYDKVTPEPSIELPP